MMYDEISHGIKRFISALELSKVMEDLGEKLSEEEVMINISNLIIITVRRGGGYQHLN